MKKLIYIIILTFLTVNVAIGGNLVIDANKQELDLQNNQINLEGNVKVKMDDMTLIGPRAVGKINPKTNKLEEAIFPDSPYAYQKNGNKKSEIKAKIIKASLLNKVVKASGDTQSVTMVNNQPVLIINADTQEYDTQIEQMRANGSVIVHYQDMVAFGDKAIVDVNKKGDVKKMQLIGNAKINQKNNKAYADRFVYTAANEEIMSIGNTYSKMIMDNGKQIEVWAQYQQYNKPANTILASNKVTIYYDNYKAYGPKVTVFPSKATNKFNKIVFIGRAKIVEKNRSIDADKIIITMEPKNFTALGNVKTIITNIDDLKDDN